MLDMRTMLKSSKRLLLVELFIHRTLRKCFIVHFDLYPPLGTVLAYA